MNEKKKTGESKHDTFMRGIKIIFKSKTQDSLQAPFATKDRKDPEDREDLKDAPRNSSKLVVRFGP